MLRKIRRRLYRDRRRWAVIAPSLFAAGALTFWGVHSVEFGAWMPVIAGMAFLLGIGGFMALANLLIPNWRHGTEVAALALLVLVALGRVWPGLSVLELTVPKLAGFIVAIGLIQQIYATRLFDRALVLRDVTLTARGRSPLDAATLYHGIAGTPGNRDGLPNPDKVIAFDVLPDDPETIRLVERIDPVGTVEEHRRYARRQPPRRAEWTWYGPTAPEGAPASSGTIRVEIAPVGRAHQITKHSRIDRLPARAALFLWLDDAIGRALDDNLAALERRVRTGHGPPAETEAAV